MDAQFPGNESVQFTTKITLKSGDNGNLFDDYYILLVLVGGYWEMSVRQQPWHGAHRLSVWFCSHNNILKASLLPFHLRRCAIMENMFLAVVECLLFFCAGIGVLVGIYLWLVWIVSLQERPRQRPLEQNCKIPKRQGLSEADLRRLPTIEFREDREARTPECGGGEGESACAVCFEPFQIGDWCRVIPACGHAAFHVQCADAWLSKSSICPICRTSAACESEEKERVTGGAAAELPEEEGQGHDHESGRCPLPPGESVVVEMPTAINTYRV